MTFLVRSFPYNGLLKSHFKRIGNVCSFSKRHWYILKLWVRWKSFRFKIFSKLFIYQSFWIAEVRSSKSFSEVLCSIHPLSPCPIHLKIIKQVHFQCCLTFSCLERNKYGSKTKILKMKICRGFLKTSDRKLCKFPGNSNEACSFPQNYDHTLPFFQENAQRCHLYVKKFAGTLSILGS